MTEAQKALLDLKNRLTLIHNLCCGTAPKQSIGELVYVMLDMPEWDVVQAELAASAKVIRDAFMDGIGMASGMGATATPAVVAAANAYAATSVDVMSAPIAYEFWNRETGHAIVDYNEHTHVGRLTAEMGYTKMPLFRSAVAPVAIRDAALEEAANAMMPALRDMLSRGDAAATIRELKSQPPKEVQDALTVANDTIKTLRREKFDLESKLRRQLAAAKEQEEIRLAAISVAALGYWTEKDSIKPEYDHPALRDVAQLYAKYRALGGLIDEPAAWICIYDDGNVDYTPLRELAEAAAKAIPLYRARESE